ncbi:MAG: hypothetical protein AAF740_01340 [Bacteroidota bacterium]
MTAELQVTNPATGEVLSPEQLKNEIKYFPGKPLSIRANMGKDGNFNVNGKDVIGKTFSFRPVSWRFFNACLYNDQKKGLYRDWVEIFFVYEYKGRKVIASILFHGYSCEAFKDAMSDLFYEDLQLWQVEVTALPQTKESNGPDKAKYHICDFEFKALKDDDLEQAEFYQRWAELVKPFRSDSISESESMEASHHYPDFGKAKDEAPQLEPAPAETVAETDETDEDDLAF